MDRSAQRLDNSNMRAPTPRLPAYALYGEPAAPAVDPLHCESIAARSRLHDWEIRPHRHENLFQLLVLARGHAEAALDGRAVALAGPALLTVPPLAAHGFRFAPDVDGWVFTVAERHWQALLRDAPELHAALHRLRGWPLQRAEARTEAVLAAAAALGDEVRGQAPWRGPALDAALLRLAVGVARALPAEAAAVGAAPERALSHVQRFRALVEAQYREQPSLAALAAQLGITPTQLNRVCQQVLGHPALGVLHARLLLEAQRDLAYTTMSVKQVALGLGFGDAAYFTRFFQRHAGCTPSAWRQASSSAAASRQTRSSTRAIP
jgi:AraC family transcriptional activator of pobA